MGAQDKTFTALFTVNYYTAYFVVDDAPYDSFVTEYGALIQTPADPQKTGYRFTGWTPDVGTMGAANQTFTAQFSINNYYAYFIADGQTIATIPTQFGAQIVPPADPSKLGYSFEGWSPSVGTMGAENQTFTALWKAIVFDADFMVGTELYFKAVTIVGQTIPRPSDPIKLGYTFTGWDYVPVAMPANNVTITATWSINTYATTFKVDNVTYDTIHTIFGLPISLPTAPSKEGYTFNGWANLPATMPAQNIILNAVFTANTYTASFTVDGVVYKNVQTLFGTEIVAPTPPTKTGNTFLGWLNVPATMPAHNVTIPASFSTNIYFAQFIVDSVNYAKVTTSYGFPIDLPAEPYKKGFTFIRWDDVPVTMPDYNVDINAVFSKNIYKATFMVDGSVWAVVDTGYGESINLPSTPSKLGYAFKQWNNLPVAMPDGDVTITGEWSVSSFDAVFFVDDQPYTTVPTNFGEKIKFPTAPTKLGFYFGGWDPFFTGTMPANNLEFHAKWVSEAYNAIFNVDDIWYDTIVTGLGAPVVAPANPTKPGYLFIGWDPGLSPAMPAYDITYNAIFIPAVSITVDFNLNGGTGTVPANQTGAEGTAVVLPAKGNITRLNYVFFGWATSPSATTALVSYAIPSANVSLYAVWNMLGNINFSGGVTVTDALWILQAASGVRVFTARELLVADVNGDGKITTTDALKILQFASGIITHF
ncbi:MAG: InlB B-repeat-containing protein, partial [Eubacteriales bacterium]